jgi:predicted esterase
MAVLGISKATRGRLKQLADSEGIAIIAPTYGRGNWFLDKDCSVLDKIYDYCLSSPDMDEKHLFLAGLSNGGTGVTRGIAKFGDRYRGFIFISAIIENSVISSPEFVGKAEGRDILVIHGNADRRIPVAAIKKSEDYFKLCGIRVTARYCENEDHFLFFSKRDEVLNQIAEWIRSTDESK